MGNNQNLSQNQSLPCFIQILNPESQIVKDFVQKIKQEQPQNIGSNNSQKNEEYIVNGQEKRIAYIIANDDYSKNKQLKNLPGVKSEVQDFDKFPNQICITTLLKKCQFECKLFRNVTQSEFIDIQEEIEIDIAISKGKGKKVNEKLVIQFVYLGHGISIEGGNDIYAVTSDSKFFSLEFVPFLSSFYSNCQMIILIDCCREAMSEEIFTKLGGKRNLENPRNYGQKQALNYIQIRPQVQQLAEDYKGISDTFKNQVMQNGSKQLDYLFLDMRKEYKFIELTMGDTTNFQFYNSKKNDKHNNKFLSLKIKGNKQLQEFCTLLKEKKIQKNNILKAEIDLKGNELKEEGAKYVSEAIKDLKNLNHLDLNMRYNELKEEGAKYVCEAIKDLKNLNHLVLNMWGNELKEEGAKYVCGAIKDLKNLNHLALNMDGNELKEEGAKYVSEAIKDLKNLNHLDLNMRDNNINTEEEEKIQQEFKKLNIAEKNILI